MIPVEIVHLVGAAGIVRCLGTEAGSILSEVPALQKRGSIRGRVM